MLRNLVYALAALFKSRSRLVAENLCLRQQLIVLKRHQVRPLLYDADRRAHRKNNHPKRAWRQVRLEIEGLDWRLCGRAQTGISMVAKSWNAAQYLGLSGEQESQRVREGQHLLADGLFRQHMIDQVGSGLDHPPGTARGAEAASLARKGHQVLVTAGITRDA